MEWEDFYNAVDLLKEDGDRLEDLLSLTLWSIHRLGKAHKEYAEGELLKIIDK